ncbi:MAG: NFACT family protein [Clostridiaceae bacterium]|nr:NFACT family protein [Clostridiaceae bacterium]
MALDGIFLYSIVKELKDELINGKVEKINQPEKDEIVLNIRNAKNSYRLLISSSSTYPKIHLTNVNKPNPLTAPMFCMVLRKYLGGGKIIDIRQLDTDRVVLIDFESMDELGFNSVYSLIIEIMGRHSNITLIRHRDKIIMDSIKHITPDINSVRSIYPGLKFIYPPESTKLNPLDFNFDNFKDFYTTNELITDENLFSKMFTGISGPFSKDLLDEFFNSNSIEAQTDLRYLFFFAQKSFLKIKEGDFHYSTYLENGVVKDFYCFKLRKYDETNTKSYSTPSILLENFYYEKDKFNRLNSKSSDLQRLINTNIDRCLKKIKILEHTLKECDDKDSFKISGELLTANIYNIKPGMKTIEVLNYYSEKEEYLSIKLDPTKSPSEIIQVFFKKYNKLKKAEEAGKIQLKNATEELDYLNSVFTNIKNSETYEEIEEIRKELMQTGYIKFKKTDKIKKAKATKPMHLISSDGIDIYVGKNNFENDALTTKFADKHDLWLHTKNIPGSHVIIKKFGDIPDNTLIEAGALAAFYSKARESLKVAVDYTEIKNVKKPTGAKPGMVIYYTNKTILSDPKSPEELGLTVVK